MKGPAELDITHYVHIGRNIRKGRKKLVAVGKQTVAAVFQSRMGMHA